MAAFVVIFAVRGQWWLSSSYLVAWAAFGALYVRAAKRGPR